MEKRLLKFPQTYELAIMNTFYRKREENELLRVGEIDHK